MCCKWKLRQVPPFFYDLFGKQAKIYTDGCGSIQDRTEDVFSCFTVTLKNIRYPCGQTNRHTHTHTLHHRLTFLCRSVCVPKDFWNLTRWEQTEFGLYSSRGFYEEFHPWTWGVTGPPRDSGTQQKDTWKLICQHKVTLWTFRLSWILYDVHMVLKEAASTSAADPFHPGCKLFHLLPSRRRYRSLYSSTTRHKNHSSHRSPPCWTFKSVLCVCVCVNKRLKVTGVKFLERLHTHLINTI